VPPSPINAVSNGYVVTTVSVIVIRDNAPICFFIYCCGLTNYSVTVNNILSVKKRLFAAQLKESDNSVPCTNCTTFELAKFLQPYDQLAFQESYQLLDMALTLPVTSVSLHCSAFLGADMDLMQYVTIGLSLVSNFFVQC